LLFSFFPVREPKPVAEWVFLSVLDGLMVHPMKLNEIIWLHQSHLIIAGRLKDWMFAPLHYLVLYASVSIRMSTIL
jgi:hypothetical protein